MASAKPRWLIFSMKVMTSPPSPQPKQCQSPVFGLTLKEGLFSPWKGQQPQNSWPRWRSSTVSATSCTKSVAWRTFSLSSSVIMTCPPFLYRIYKVITWSPKVQATQSMLPRTVRSSSSTDEKGLESRSHRKNVTATSAP